MSQKTVAKLFEDAGDMAIGWFASLQGLTIKQIQGDELYSFVAARSFNVDKMTRHVEGAGTNWGWLAICAESKLVFSYHLGDRTGEDAYTFVDDLFSKLKRAPDGRFEVRPQINTDGLPAYRQAIADAAGAYADHGVLLKRYEKIETKDGKVKTGRFIGADRMAQAGRPLKKHIHTSHIERQNLSVRTQNRRFARRTNAFSKTRQNHERHLALWALHHNFCWVPRPKREEVIENGKLTAIWIKRGTAAMQAGLTTCLWTLDDLLKMVDHYITVLRPRKVRKDKKAPPPKLAVDPTAAPFWVYQPFRASQPCKVHAASCCNCRGGQGRNVNASGKDGKWWGFLTKEEAAAEAERMKPGRVETCRMCLAERRKMAGINT